MPSRVLRLSLGPREAVSNRASSRARPDSTGAPSTYNDSNQKQDNVIMNAPERRFFDVLDRSRSPVSVIPITGASHTGSTSNQRYTPPAILSSIPNQKVSEFDDSGREVFWACFDDRLYIAQQRAIEEDRRRLQAIAAEERCLAEGPRERKGPQEEAGFTREREAERRGAERIRLEAEEADRIRKEVEVTERHRLEREAKARRKAEEEAEQQRLEDEGWECADRWESDEAERIRWLLNERQHVEDSRLARMEAMREKMRMEFQSQKAGLGVAAAAAQLEAEEAARKRLQEQSDAEFADLIAEETQGPPGSPSLAQVPAHPHQVVGAHPVQANAPLPSYEEVDSVRLFHYTPPPICYSLSPPPRILPSEIVRAATSLDFRGVNGPGRYQAAGEVDIHQQPSVWSKMRSSIGRVSPLRGLFPPTIVQTPHGTSSAGGPASTGKRSRTRTTSSPEWHPVSPFVDPPEDSFRVPGAFTAFDGTQDSHALQRKNQGTVRRKVSIETGLIEALCRLQGQPHFREIISTTNDWGQTLAHVSIFYGYPLLLSSLVDWRINLAIADVNGFTALHYAYMKEDLDSVRILRRGGASEVVMDKLGRTPLDLRPEGL